MEYTPQEIIAGLLEKNALVLRYLYRIYGPTIAGYVRKNSGSEEDVTEMIQVVMLELWIAVRDGRYKEEGKLGHFIYQLTANSWRDELRKRRKQPQLDLPENLQIADEGHTDLAARIVKDRYLNAIHEGIQQLGEVCQDIIKMYHLQKTSLQEIAEQLQYDYDNLRKRIFDCRKKLKQLTEGILAKNASE